MTDSASTGSGDLVRDALRDAQSRTAPADRLGFRPPNPAGPPPEPPPAPPEPAPSPPMIPAGPHGPAPDAGFDFVRHAARQTRRHGRT